MQGRKASLYAALGCTLGIVPHLLATVLGLAFLPQFVPHEVSRPLLLQLLLLSAVFMAMTFAVFVIYGWVAHASRRLVIESAAVLQWLRYGLASAFTGLGIKLALTEK